MSVRVSVYKRQRSRVGWEFNRKVPGVRGSRWLHVWWGSPNEHRWWARSIYLIVG